MYITFGEGSLKTPNVFILKENKVKMSETEQDVIKRILENTKEILEILDRINQSQEKWIKED